MTTPATSSSSPAPANPPTPPATSPQSLLAHYPPRSAQSPAIDPDRAPADPATPAIRILLVGPETASLAIDASPAAVEHAPTLLEAVWLAHEPRLASVSVIAAAVAQDIEQIEAATRALRKVYPAARIYLLCDPADEVRCRKARVWGATDYLILPLDDAALAQIAALPASPPGAPRPAAPADALRQPVHLHHAAPSNGLSLAQQAALLFDLAAGHADTASRAVAFLQQHRAWGGALRYAPPDPGQRDILPADHPAQLRAPVAAPQSSLFFGTLILETAGPLAPAPEMQPALDEAAIFLASLFAVARRYEQLRALAITDELSGAYNRRYFTKFVANLLDRARDNRFRVTLLLFDIDDFKQYNDRFGHASGDAIIRELIKLLRACTRPHDLVARIGGDEFAVVFWDNEAPRQPNSEHPRDAIAAAERFRRAIHMHQWPATCNIQGEVSISGGLASFPWDADTLQELMAKADEALLRAKAAGKNAILLHAGGCPPQTDAGDASLPV